MSLVAFLALLGFTGVFDALYRETPIGEKRYPDAEFVCSFLWILAVSM